MLSTILKADSAGPAARHVYEKSHIVLAGLVPLGAVSDKDSYLRRGADLGLALSIPVHSHIALNYVLTDYIPKGVQGVARLGVLGISGVTLLGLLKLNLAGPGITQTVKDLWVKDEPLPKQ